MTSGTSLGKASLTEMESDLAAVDGLKSSVLVKLQELSIGSEKKAPVRKVRVSEFFNRPIQTQAELDKALDLHTGFTSEVHRRRRGHHSGVNHAQSSPDL